MNKAFVREADDERASDPLPDRAIPAEPNLVTPEGLAHIQEMADLAQEQHTAARDAGDASADDPESPLTPILPLDRDR